MAILAGGIFLNSGIKKDHLGEAVARLNERPMTLIDASNATNEYDWWIIGLSKRKEGIKSEVKRTAHRGKE